MEERQKETKQERKKGRRRGGSGEREGRRMDGEWINNISGALKHTTRERSGASVVHERSSEPNQQGLFFTEKNKSLSNKILVMYYITLKITCQ